MGDEATTALDDVLAAMRSHGGEVLLAAIDYDGVRVPLAEPIDLKHQLIPVPDDRATMLQLVVAADRLVVVDAWERVRQTGVGFGTVRLLTDPDRAMSLTFVDATDRYGCFLGLLFDEGAATGAGKGEVLPEMLVVASRPRQAMITKSMTAIITSIDANVTKILGWAPEEMIGKRSSTFVHPDDQDRAIENWMELLSNRESQRLRFRHLCEDGDWRWVEVENVYHHDEDPEKIVVEAHVSDISEEMAAHEALRYREQLFSRLAESLPTGVLQIERDGGVVYANERLRALLHAPIAEQTLDRLLASVSDHDRRLLVRSIDRVFTGNEDADIELDVHAGSTVRRCAISIVGVATHDGVATALVCVNDITRSAQLQEDLRLRATFDVLTSCFNRASIMSALDAALADPTSGGGVGVLFLDLDNFKPTNDRLGHAAGDELLRTAADILRETCRADDLVGRLGGDEFLVMCRDLTDPVGELMALAQRVHDALHTDIALEAGTVRLGASIGLAAAAPGMSGDALVSLADHAMYEAKRNHAGPVLATESLVEPAEHVA